MSALPPQPTRAIILVVDDEDYVADLLADMLKAENYTVYTAYNGEIGLRYARELTFDLAVIDIMLPNVSGDEIVNQLRSTEGKQQVPILMISAGAYPQQMQAGVRFLSKPFEMDTFLRVIQEQLAAPLLH